MSAAELERWPTATLHDFCQAMDTRLGLAPGGTLLLVRHLLATRVWRVDMMQPIVETKPMRTFTQGAPSSIRMAQA